MFPDLETARLRLTRIVPEDAQSMFELFSDPKVVQYYDLEPFTEVAEAEKLMTLFESRYTSGTGIRWAIRERDSSDLIGTCGFNAWSQKMRNGVIGYDLRPSHCGGGFTTEAVAAMLRAAFAGALRPGCGMTRLDV